MNVVARLAARVWQWCVAHGAHDWRDIDRDRGWTLQECRWTGKRRTIMYGRDSRNIWPGPARWERDDDE